MTTETEKTVTKIKDVDSRQVGEGVRPREQEPISAEAGESATPAKRPALKGVVERKFQRRHSIKTMHGVMRSHARLISQLHNGSIPLERGEVLSRAYGRHKDILTAIEQSKYLASIDARLAAIEAERRLPEVSRDER